MPPNMANRPFQQNNTRGQRSRPFTRTPHQTRPFSGGRSFTRSPHQNHSRPFTRSPHPSRPFTRSSHQSRPFTRSSHSSRPFSRGFHQSRPFNRNSESFSNNNSNASSNGSNFRGQSYDRNPRGSFRINRGGRRSFRATPGTSSTFQSTRGASSTFQSARGSFQTTRGTRLGFRNNRGTRSSFNARGNATNARGNAANAQQRLAANMPSSALKRKIPASTQPASKIPKTDTLEKQQRTIFVGNVPLETTELEIKKIFSKYGAIISVRFRGVPRADIRQLKKMAFIKKNFHEKRNSMNAYVVFATKEEAEKAQQVNGTKFKEHILRVNISTMTRPNTDKQTIFVGNLPFDVEDNDLIEIFKDCGSIESVRISREASTAVGRGFAFVNFETIDAVELALQMENVKFKNRVLRIMRSDTKIDQYAGSVDWTSVKIENLPQSTTKAYLSKAFEECGEIINITFNAKSPIKKSAIVAFRTAEAANNAMHVQIVIKKKLLTILKDSFDPHKHIFIRNVPLNAKNFHVKNVLDKCGAIKACKLLLTPLPPYTAGFGIVEFVTVEGAKNALKLHSFEIMNNAITIESYIKDKSQAKTEDEDSDDDDDSNEEQPNDNKNASSTEEESECEDLEDIQLELDKKIDDDDEESEDSDAEDEEAGQSNKVAEQANKVAGQEDDTGLVDDDSSEEVDFEDEEEEEELEEEEEEDDDDKDLDFNDSD